MRILLYNPDNGVTRNFMPHLWMFLLQALTPPEHEVLLIDGNAQPMTDAELVRFVLDRAELGDLDGLAVREPPDELTPHVAVIIAELGGKRVTHIIILIFGLFERKSVLFEHLHR